jgi:catalase
MKKWMVLICGFAVVLSGASWSAVSIIYKLANIDFPLYKNEHYWGGSKQAELMSFIRGGLRVQQAQEKIAQTTVKIGNDREYKAGVGRVFHRKSHGCIVGKFNLLTDRPKDPQRRTFVGMFDPKIKSSYDVVMRFSNGIGYAQDDKLPDVRGTAIKVFDVYNSATGRNQTVDFLMTNSPTPFGKDFLEFADFMDLVADAGPTIGGVFFASHPRADLSLLRATGLPKIDNYKVKSVATIRYWGGHPYLLGPDQAMKFNIIPTEKYEPSVRKIKTDGSFARDYYAESGDYLRYDLEQRVRDHPIRFLFAVQLEKNTIDTPIEDNLKEWEESVTPSIPVAELVFDQQDIHVKNYEGMCEEMRFTPAHYIPENRPLSNMGRGRLFGYEASQIGRKAEAAEPDSSFVRKLREEISVN